jgi:hypothetical protein
VNSFFGAVVFASTNMNAPLLFSQRTGIIFGFVLVNRGKWLISESIGQSWGNDDIRRTTETKVKNTFKAINISE